MVDAPDGRVLEFKRTEKTKFFRDAQEVKPAELKPGDQVTVESTQDQDGFLYAQNVYLEKGSPPQKDDGTPAALGGRAPGNIPAPGAEESEDIGPPTLKRGVPRDRSAVEERKSPESAGIPDAPAQTAQEDAAPSSDPVIEKAREATAKLTAGLPNYVCKEFMTRYASTTQPVDWRPLDVVSTDVVYDNGHEDYRDISINGKPFHKRMEEMSGAWSTGEFGTMLVALFSPWTAADFRLRREGSIEGVQARVYDFEVDRTHSHWQVHAPSQSIEPGYKGSVWIEPETGRVLRLEIQARALPEQFPLDTVESAVDYDHVLIGGAKFLLPVHAETLACQRGTNNCSRNRIDFRNYHKYEASSDITFADSK
jgi:hypothetical protein